MANRFPLVLDTTDGNKIKELPADDNLNLRESSILDVQNINALGIINAPIITVNGKKLVANQLDKIDGIAYNNENFTKNLIIKDRSTEKNENIRLA